MSYWNNHEFKIGNMQFETFEYIYLDLIFQTSKQLIETRHIQKKKNPVTLASFSV